MSGVSIRIRVDGGEAVERALAEMVRRIRDAAPAFDEIGAAMVTNVQHRFETGRGPGGAPWKKSARAKRQNGQTLVDQGHLLQSITHDFGRDFAAVGSNRVYAGIHQFGGKTGRNRAVDMPARPYLGLDGNDEDDITDIVTDYLRGAIT